jgi:small subunit ribosomal protein S1
MDNETKTPEPEQENQVPEEENTADQPGWFQDFVDHYDVDKPQQGEMLKGTILDIQDSSIVLDVGFKRDAIIPGQDIERVDPEIRDNLSIGDEIFVSVIRTPMGDDDLLVSLQRGLTYKTWIKADELAQSNEQVELEVVDQNRGGLLVAFENLRGFIPNSHIPAIRRGTSTQLAGEIKSEMIGKTLPVKVIEVDQKERRLVFSARVVQKGQREKRLNEIEIDSVVKSRVVNIVDFGVFVDLDGVDGLVHKSEIDWERIPHPSKIFKLGDEIEVKVIGIDKEKERVSLSRKILLPNPWLKHVEKFQVGDLVEGLVVSVLDFGAFIELTEGLQGLVHVSEIGYANTEDPKAVVKKGDPVLVKIMSIDPDRERISLSMRRVPISDQMEWIMNLEDASEGILLDGEEAIPDEEIDTEGSEPSATTDVDVEEIEEVTSDEDPGEDEVSQEDPEEDQSTPEVSESPE